MRISSQSFVFLTSLLEVLDFWTLSVGRGLPVDVLYIDYDKVFDKVQHNC